MKKSWRKYLLTGVVISTLAVLLSQFVDTAAAGLKVLNLAVASTHHYQVERDVAFGQQPWQRLNLFSPAPTPERKPVIVFFYGGGWNWGKKSYFDFVAAAFVKRGYLVVIPDYIKYPQGRFPQFVEDGAKALAWVNQHIAAQGGDLDRIYLVGHSAGAHTAALLASDASYLANEGMSVKMVKAVAGVAGPYNFTPQEPQYIATFGRQNFTTMRVNHHVSGNEPAMILLHSEDDKTVGQFNQQTLVEALQAVNVPVHKVLYQNSVSHVQMLLKLHPWFAGQVDVAEDIDRFFKTL